jgi:hypothetical protein
MDTKGKMNTKHRKNIVREAKKLIKLEVPNYNQKPIGERESILDRYINQICIKRGWDFAHFYCEEGKVLDKILN